MNERPVRLVVDDDRRRSRLTVFFRFFLAIPHFVWLGLWTFAVFFTAIAQWVSPWSAPGLRPVESFHAAYIRYATHVGAYLSLAANPFPGFLGDTAYPIDVEIEPAERQAEAGCVLPAAHRRARMVPAVDDQLRRGGGNGAVVWRRPLLPCARCCCGLSRLVRLSGARSHAARASQRHRVRTALHGRGLRVQLAGDQRVPLQRPSAACCGGPTPAHPIGLVVDDDRRRSRLTTFFRLFLAVPHIVWLLLWGHRRGVRDRRAVVLSPRDGRPAASLHRFLASYIRYQTHVAAFLYLVANPFPGFTGRPGYPIELNVAPPARQSRWVTLFRFFLALPAFLLVSALNTLL